MDAPTARKRISAQERRQMILHAARKQFAEQGFEGARTSQIAAASNISEALVNRHFASKEALYRAVLRNMVRDQNRMYEALGTPAPSTGSLIAVVHEFLRSCVDTKSGALREGLRIMLASLGGDGSYAGLVYRRAMRLQLAPLVAALASANEAGDLEGHELAPENIAMFVEHVGTMIAAGMALPARFLPYSGCPESVLTEATWFCCRGIGLTRDAIDRHLPGWPQSESARSRHRLAPRPASR